MAINKVVVGNQIKLDLSDATVDTEKIVSGYTAYGSTGEKLTGSLKIVTVYTGSTQPSSSLGNDGDIYFKTS